MEEVQSIFTTLLFSLQLGLALWQIMKLTPVGAIIQGVMGWLLQPLGLSPAYGLLQLYGGRVFKRVVCLTATEHVPALLKNMDASAINSEGTEEIRVFYLGADYNLRREGERLFLNGEMSYYITPKLWAKIADLMERFGQNGVVCIKGYKEIWEGVTTGAVMSFSEVLDSLILDNNVFIPSNTNILLPVNLSVSEEKLLKFINLVGLFLQIKDLHWAIPLSFSFTSAVLEFCTPLRVWLYGEIEMLFCWAVHLLCDRLRYSMRREVYSLGKWVENLKPSNDIEFRVLRGDRCVPLAGGAKVKKEAATLMPYCYDSNEEEQLFSCGAFNILCVFFPLEDNPELGLGRVVDDRMRPICQVHVACNRNEFMKLCRLVSCIAKHRSGSLKLYERNNKVQVYGLKQSVIHYAKSGFPPVYEMKLGNVIVT